MFLSTKLKLDADQLVIGRTPMVLPRKPNHVLLLLLAAAPNLVTREHLIDVVWSGNFVTGEKGLNQALWQIRGQLRQAGGQTEWIETLAREGYRWRGPTPVSKSSLVWPRRWQAAVALAVISLGVILFQALNGAGHERAISSAGSVAMLKNNEVIVNHHQGCRFRLLAKPGTTFSSPVFSNDGKRLALNVNSAQRCEMRVLTFKSRQVEEFDYCLVNAAS